MLGVDVDVLLVLLFDGEWFLLLRVVVFISFPCAGLPGPCCNAALPRHLPLRFFFPSALFASALPASLSLDAFALLSSPSLFRNVGRRLPSMLVLFGWLVRLARVFFSFVRFAIAP